MSSEIFPLCSDGGPSSSTVPNLTCIARRLGGTTFMKWLKSTRNSACDSRPRPSTAIKT
jgi:hypothetical protein